MDKFNFTPQDRQVPTFKSYTQRGFHVLPLQPGEKVPHGRLAPHGYKDATNDPAKAARWDRIYPPLNIGVRVGTPWEGSDLRLAVVVLYPGVLPPEAYEDLPYNPWIASTLSGGLHLYVWEDGDSEGGITRLVDETGRAVGEVRAGKGYVVAPPSVVDGRQYEWLSPVGEDGLPLDDWWVIVMYAVQHAIGLLDKFGIRARPKGRRSFRRATRGGCTWRPRKARTRKNRKAAGRPRRPSSRGGAP